jgi:signal transduction histidine kinase
MMVFIVVESIMIAGVTLYQFNKQNSEYHEGRLERKESNLLTNIKYEIEKSNSSSLLSLNNSVVQEIADIHNLEFELYTLDGILIKSSTAVTGIRGKTILDSSITDYFQNESPSRYVESDKNSSYFKSSYNLVSDFKGNPLGIIYIPYFADDTSSKMELSGFLIRLGFVHGNMILIAFVIAYFISNFVTKSLDSIGDTIKKTNLQNQNVKIDIDNTPTEVVALIESYNTMIDELKSSAIKLAKSERETAWREMAKQVAHEIKNPLTPMRLSIQTFERGYSKGEEFSKQRIKEFSDSLIQQIDTMSSIATAFSDFAEMPEPKKEKLNVVEVVELAVDIFNRDQIEFESSSKTIEANFDRTQLIRVITNLLKNAFQAIPENRTPEINVKIFEDDSDVKISISDNGYGISKSDTEKIFEPSFTTKSSGMGLGLSMIKSIITAYNGTIKFSSKSNVGTTFNITFPKK